MLTPRKLNLGLEAIQVQSDLLFKELTLAFQRIREEKAYKGKALKAIDIPAIIFNRTGVKVSFEVEDSSDLNAYVHIPTVDKNNPLVYNYFKPYLGSDDFDGLIKNKKLDQVVGWVDLAHGRLGGAFSQVQHKAVVLRGMFESKLVSCEEIAAVMLHELGHLFTYYEFLGHVLTTNIVLHAATQQFFKADDKVRKVRLVHETCKALDVEIDDVESLVECTDKEVFQTVFVRKKILNTRSSLGTPIYDLTATEALADQFAVRMGAGRALATGLDKIMRSYGGGSSYRTTAGHVIATVFNVALFFFFSALTFGLFLLILFINPAEKTYDPPEARLRRIRNEMMAAIKSEKMSAERKAETLLDIKAVDQLLKQVDDKRGLIEMFYTSVLPSGRQQYQQLKFQVELEKLVNNDLFLAHERLKQLS